jgi:hypothetical protein
LMAATREFEDLASNKEGKNSKCFAERRLQALSPEISPSVIPNLYRSHFATAVAIALSGSVVAGPAVDRRYLQIQSPHISRLVGVLRQPGN